MQTETKTPSASLRKRRYAPLRESPPEGRIPSLALAGGTSGPVLQLRVLAAPRCGRAGHSTKQRALGRDSDILKRDNMKRAIILAALILTASCVKEHTATPLQPGDQLPDFSVITLTGQTAGKDILAGKPSAIILFSTTCPDCHRQLPEMELMHAAAGEAVGVLAIARDEGREAVASFWNSAGLSMDVAAPGNRQVYDLFDRGSRSGVPLVYLADENGVIKGFTNDRKTLTANEMLTILIP